jgi:gliding motility-associated-like protein
MLFVAGLLGAMNVAAQLTCNFTADTLQGCSPLQVRFTDLSSGGGAIVYRNWSFGNGGFSIGNNPTPSRLYTTPGAYTVTLTVSDGIDTATASYVNYIRVWQNPVARFHIYPVNWCRPATFSFADSSLAGDAPLGAYRWDYGDLTTPGTQQHPSHSYAFEGTYSVTLTVTDTHGCRASLQKINVIRVVYPLANFTVNKTYDCSAPSTFNFTFTGKGRAPISYKWYFGDGDSSSSQHPAHTYGNMGTYSVRLIVTDSAGCRDTLTRSNLIRIAPLSANFQIPDTMCRHLPDTFFNTGMGGSSYFWTFGDGDTSSQFEPLKAYAASGFYQVKLKVTATPQCKDSISKTVYVEVVSAGYHVTYDSICRPELVTYRDTSTGNIKTRMLWLSQFEQGKYPLNRRYMNGTNSIVAYGKALCSPRTVSDTLMVETHYGCRDTAFYSARTRIEGDNIWVRFRLSDVCAPAVADSFRSQHCLRFGPVSWLWEFTDTAGTDTVYSSYPNYTDSLLTWGQRSGKLWVTDSAGCVHKANFSYRAGAKPQAFFTTNKDTICLTDTLLLRNFSQDSSLGLTYEWNFGEGPVVPPNVSRHTQNVYKYCGPKTVRLYVAHFECRDTAEKTIWVSGPQGSASLSNSCLDPMKFSFTGTAACGFNRFYWSFGDTSAPDSTSFNVQHTYASAGIYNGTLTLINDTTGCRYSAPFKAQPYIIKANIDTTHISISLCAPLQLSVSGMRSAGVHANKYYWNFGNGQTAAFVNSSPSQTYPTTGSYTIRLIIEDQYGCRDTAYHPVSVYGPQVQYSLPNPICHNELHHIPAIITTGGIGIDSVAWLLNGANALSADTFVLQHGVDTTGRPYASVYYDTLELKLWVRDSAFCTDSVVNQFLVGRVITNTTISDSALCAGDTIFVRDWAAPAPFFQYRWITGNGDTLTNYSGYTIYHSRGDTVLWYTSTEPFGCAATDTFHVNVEGIDTVLFSASVTDTNCYPATIFFNDASNGDSIRLWIWNFGDGSAPVTTTRRDSLARIFSLPGQYDVGLHVITRNGCSDSLIRPLYININGPYAEFSLPDDSVCKFEPVTFLLDTANVEVKQIWWDFADGRVDSTSRDTVLRRHSYGTAGRYTCIFVLTDSLGKCRQYRQYDVTVEEVNAGFSIANDSAGCTPFTFTIADASQLANAWQYADDEGNSATVADPRFTLLRPGSHLLRQDVWNTFNNCRDSAFGSVTVWPLPQVVASPDTIVCKGKTVQLWAQGAHKYTWSPNQYLSANKGNPVYAGPPDRQQYTVTGTDSNGCQNRDSTTVFVQWPPQFSLPSDTSVIIGELVRLFAHGGNMFKWRWTPADLVTCDTCLVTTAELSESSRLYLTVSDSLGCFEVTGSFWVEVEEKYSVDVPQTFTPNGDGINDIIYPAGWGIEDLIDFKVYNRWGELVFEANPEQWGWDGTYKGTPQNPDTYLYTVSVRGYSGEEIIKQGYITLLR